METAEVAEPISGDKLYQERARRALPLLVRQAFVEKPITYEDLAQELGMSNARNLNYVLGSIGRTLENFAVEWDMEIPMIQALVVNKTTRIPGEGISGFISEEDYKNLSKRQQRVIVDTILSKIYTFSEWKKILEFLGLDPAQDNYDGYTSKAAKGGGKGGEGSAHKALKLLIAHDPRLVGITAKIIAQDVEHSLPSGDCIDVHFTTRGEEIAVEVKSDISNVADYTRGLYQCIKYLAVVEARQASEGRPQNARAILALATTLPEELIPLRNILGVEVVENISSSFS